MSHVPVLGVTVGDPAGIGPEITLLTVTDPEMRALARAVVYADPAIMRRAARVVGSKVTINVVTDPAEAGDDPNVVDVIDIGVIADAELVEWGKVCLLYTSDAADDL